MERRLSGVDTSLGGVEQALLETAFRPLNLNGPALRLPVARMRIVGGGSNYAPIVGSLLLAERTAKSGHVSRTSYNQAMNLFSHVI